MTPVKCWVNLPQYVYVMWCGIKSDREFSMYVNGLFFTGSKRREKGFPMLTEHGHLNEHTFQWNTGLSRKKVWQVHPNPLSGLREILWLLRWKKNVISCGKNISNYGSIVYKHQSNGIIWSGYSHKHSQGLQMKINEQLSLKALNSQLEMSFTTRGEWKCILVFYTKHFRRPTTT